MCRQPRHSLCLLVLIGGFLGCTPSPAPLPPPPRDPLPLLAGRPGMFSAERAWADLEALAAVGPRAAGSEGAAGARAYISGELKAVGLDVVTRSLGVTFPALEGAPAGDPAAGDRVIDMVNVEATIAGEFSELIVLAAPYDSAFHETIAYPGVNDGASGAALLLELARVLVKAPLPYTLRFLFLDGEASTARDDDLDATAGLLGSAAAAAGFGRRGELANIRLLFYFNRVSDADLRIARDRFSHRLHRDAIWMAAAAQGHGDVFQAAADYEAPFAGHRSFIDAGMRRTVAIVDPSLGAAGTGELGGPSEDDTLERSSPRSLEIVGRVTLAGLESIATRFRKIDRFADSPTAASPETAKPPAPEPAEAPATGGEEGGGAPSSGGPGVGDAPSAGAP